MDPNGRAYEDFVPPYRMVRDPPAHTLSVDLSAAGYKKEHIKVQLVHSHRRLILRGERPVGGNRWRRFRLEFKIPDDCNTKGIQARFDKGFVNVTMPGLKQETIEEGPLASPAAKPTDAATASGVQGGAERKDGDRAAPARSTAAAGGEEVEKDQDKRKVQKEEAVQQRVMSSAKGGGRDDGHGSAGGEAMDAAPSRQGYAFIRGRKQMATTVLGVVLVLISLGIYVKYSLWP